MSGDDDLGLLSFVSCFGLGSFVSLADETVPPRLPGRGAVGLWACSSSAAGFAGWPQTLPHQSNKLAQAVKNGNYERVENRGPELPVNELYARYIVGLVWFVLIFLKKP